MKKTLYFVLLLNFCSSVNTLYAQQNAINFSAEPYGKICMNYERAISKKISTIIEYQKWHQITSKTTSIDLILISSSQQKLTKVDGYRFELLSRFYKKKVLHGAFLEVGIYQGKHDIQITSTQSTTNLIAFFNFDLDHIGNDETSTEEYKSVKVGGGKLGGGIQESYGIVNMELSGGLNFNVFNSQNIRPTTGLKKASPYFRLAFGIAF